VRDFLIGVGLELRLLESLALLLALQATAAVHVAAASVELTSDERSWQNRGLPLLPWL